MSVLDERRNSKRTFCHNYADKNEPTVIHYGCDAEIVWKERKKYNLDGTPHKCSHSNELRSKANEAANNTAAALKPVLEGKSVKDAFKKFEPEELPASPQTPSATTEILILAVLNRIATNQDAEMEILIQMREFLKQVLKGAK